MRKILNTSPQSPVFGYIIYALIAIAFTCAVFIGCGSDEITGGNGNPPVSQEIFRLDSISVSPATNMVYDATITITSNTADSLKVEFTAQTNAPQNCSPSVTIDFSDTTGTFFSTGCTELSQFRSYILYTKSKGTNYNITLALRIFPPASTNHYVVLKDFHISKVQ